MALWKVNVATTIVVYSPTPPNVALCRQRAAEYLDWPDVVQAIGKPLLITDAEAIPADWKDEEPFTVPGGPDSGGHTCTELKAEESSRP